MYSDHLDDRKMQTFAEAGIPPQEIGHLLICERCRDSYEQYLVLFALLSQREEKLMPGHAVERTREKLLTYARSRRRVLTLLLSLPLALSLVLAMGLYPEHPSLPGQKPFDLGFHSSSTACKALLPTRWNHGSSFSQAWPLLPQCKV
jgi:predicted anti-sigma-YlaC factor YlaD